MSGPVPVEEPPPLLPAEVWRRRSAPWAALAASTLALVCLTGVVAVILQLTLLMLLGRHVVGSLCLIPAFAFGTALMSLMWSRRLGASPFLAMGAALAAIGIVLGHRLVDGVQLTLAATVLGAAAGCLLGGAAAIPFELAWRWARITALVWAVPVVAGWPVLAWLFRAGDPGPLSLVVPHAVWFAAPAIVVVTLWSAGSLLAAPIRVASDLAGWRDAWLGLSAPLGLLCFMAIAVALAPGLRLIWLRPVVLCGTALALAVWILITMLLPDPQAKIAFMVVSFVAAAVPSTIELLVLANDRYPVDGVGARITVVVLVAAVGVVAGRRWPRPAILGGLVAIGGFALLAWPGTESAWLSTTLVAALSGAGVAVVAGGLACAMESEACLRFVSFGFIAALLAGGLVAVPLAWSLVGDPPVTAAASRAGARVLLGLIFAASAPIAAHAYVLGRRIDRRRARVVRTESLASES